MNNLENSMVAYSEEDYNSLFADENLDYIDNECDATWLGEHNE